MPGILYNPAEELTALVHNLMAIHATHDDATRSDLCRRFYFERQLYSSRIRIEMNNNKLALSENSFSEYIELLKFRTGQPFGNFGSWLHNSEYKIKKAEDVLELCEKILNKKSKDFTQPECAILIMAGLYEIQGYCISGDEHEIIESATAQELLRAAHYKKGNILTSGEVKELAIQQAKKTGKRVSPESWIRKYNNEPNWKDKFQEEMKKAGKK